MEELRQEALKKQKVEKEKQVTLNFEKKQREEMLRRSEMERKALEAKEEE